MRPVQFAALVVAVCAGVVESEATPAYRVFELLPLPTHAGGSTAPKGVASGGEAVGYSVSADDREGHAVVWPAGVNVPVALSSERSFAFAVSDDGLSVGGAINTPQRNHAALFVGGATLLLPDPFPPPGENPSTYVSAVIDGSTAAGQAEYRGAYRAVLWGANGATLLPDLGYPVATVTDANAGGTICGRAVLPGSFQHRGVVWENGMLARVLQPVPGRTHSMAEAINAAGDVAGTSYASAVVWPAGSAVPYALPLPPTGLYASALGINDHGWVVGVVSDSRGRAAATLWTDAQTVIDLNAAIPPGSGWELNRAMYINADGVIVGEGRFNGRFTAFRLEPVKAMPIVVLPGILGTRLLEQTPSGDQEVWFDSNGPFDALTLDEFGQDTRPIVTGTLLDSGLEDTYGGLLSHLEANGYQRDVTLFPIAYDWRRHNGDHAQLLALYIETEVLPASDSDRAIVIAHSMGGLIARRLALTRPDLVEKVIYLGTPHTGAAAAFAALAFDEDLTPFIGVPAGMVDVAWTFPSAYQLLPRSPFVFSLDEQRMMPLADTYPSFLRSVRWLPLADQFHTDIATPPAVAQVQVVGSALPTLGSLVTYTTLNDRKWFPVIENGDGTVVRASAGAAPGAPQPLFIDGVAHDALPADPCVQDIILRAIRDDAPPACSSSQPFALPPGVSWSTGSPVRVTISDPADRTNGDIPRSRFFTLESNEGGFLAEGVEYRFEIVAHETGVFSLTFRDQLETLIEWSGVPVAAGSRATLVLHEDGTTSAMALDGISIDPGPIPLDVALALLASAVERLAVDHGLRASLLAKIDAAARAVARDQRHTAENILHALLNEIDAQAGKGLAPADAKGLRTAVVSILTRM